MLNWYDEPCGTLAACIAGLHKAGVDHLVAVDGAYLLYPNGKASSPPDQAATIQQACQSLGIATTIHTPNQRWAGNEVEKRTRMFALALAASDPGDWWLSMDADMVVTQAPHDLKGQLEQTILETAQATIVEYRDLDATQHLAQQFEWPRSSQHAIRLLFQAQPMCCDTNHYTYTGMNGKVLWNSDSADQVPALDLLDLIVEHRDNQRPIDRQNDKRRLYQLRDTLGVERGACTWDGCSTPSDRTVGRNLRLTDTPEGYGADLVAMCEKHAKRVEYENDWQLRQWGIDPEKVTA